MAVVTLLLKTAFLAGVVAVYWRPLEIAAALGVPPPEGGAFEDRHAHVARFGLTVVSYSWALSSASSSWFYAILALIALQTISWASFLSEQRVLSNALAGVLDEQTEKEIFEGSAIVLFAMLVTIILFAGGGRYSDMHRRRLVAFYKKNNPDKITDVDKILKKYEGKEELLFTRLHRKYSRVLSHTAIEDAVDDLDHDGPIEADVPETGEYIEEVEYIQESTTVTTSSSDGATKTKTTTTTKTSSSTSLDEVDFDEEQDEATLPMLQPKVKSPAAGKAPSGPVSPAHEQASGSAAGSRSSSPPRSPGSSSTPRSNSVRMASEEARRALQQRVQQRVAQLQSRSSMTKTK